MLFNSFDFIFIFLPITLVLYHTFRKLDKMELAKGVLLVGCLIFYAYWDVRYLPLLLFSLFINYTFGRLLSDHASKSLLVVGIVINLGLLGYFKYVNFFIDTVNLILNTNILFFKIILPLGISFFTFQQIGFLVDSYRQETKEYNLLNYSLFVTFFPQLIAGPIVHHKSLIPQFKNPLKDAFSYENINKGLLIFFLGLFKKIIIADTLSPWVHAFFNGSSIGIFESWAGVLAYTMQLYFDFSAYSDMAIGLGNLFGIKLPINFNAPYQANSIIDFWKRWHITLSTFLRDYLYIPLGGSRKGTFKRYRNLMITMLLGGLWHGAGWTFVIWGGLHGLYLVINHGFRKLGFSLPKLAGRILTFIAVMIGWVFFRAPNLSRAWTILGGMFGQHGVGSIAALPGGFIEIFTLTGLMVLVHLLPNSIRLTKSWRPNVVWLGFTVFLMITTIFSLNTISEFLYFQF